MRNAVQLCLAANNILRVKNDKKKNQGFNGIRTRDLRVALPTEL